jgi:hypothetical protein
VQARLLAFFHAGISGEESIVSQWLEILFAHAAQSASDGHADRSRLACQSAAIDAADDIDAIRFAYVSQGLQDILLVLGSWEEFLKRAPIDYDLSCSGAEAYASHCRLATTGSQTISVNLVFLDRYHGVLDVL